MDKEVNPLLAFLIILLIFSLIGINIWATGIANEQPKVRQLIALSKSELALSLDNKIFIIHENETLSQKIELSNFNIGERAINNENGDFIFVNDDEFILHQGTSERTTKESIEIFTRKSNSDNSLSGEFGLVKCSINTLSCTTYAPDLKTLNRAFHLASSGENIILSDTSRHNMVLISQSGEVLAESSAGFQFPNHGEIHEGNLFVTNTNKNEVAKIDISESKFGYIENRYDMVQPGGYKWPADIIKIPQGWIVMTQKSDMAFGKLAVYNDNWEFLRNINTPTDFDPISFEYFNQVIYVSDLSSLEIHKFDLNGENLGFLKLKELESILKPSRQNNNFYSLIADSTWFIGGLIFLVLLIWGVLSERKAQNNINPEVVQPASKSATMEPLANKNKEFWLPKNKRLLTSFYLGFVATLATIPFCFYMISIQESTDIKTITMFSVISVFIVVIAISSYITLKVIKNSALGINGNAILIKSTKNRVISGEAGDIIYSDRGLIINRTYLQWRYGEQSLFDSVEIEKWIRPRLVGAHYVNAIDMTRLLFKLRHPNIVLPMLLIFIISLMLIPLMLIR